MHICNLSGAHVDTVKFILTADAVCNGVVFRHVNCRVIMITIFHFSLFIFIFIFIFNINYVNLKILQILLCTRNFAQLIIFSSYIYIYIYIVVVYILLFVHHFSQRFLTNHLPCWCSTHFTLCLTLLTSRF